MSKKMTFVAACNDYFGKKPAQTLMEFRDELKLLSDKDKADPSEMFKTVGYEIVAA